MLDAAKALWAIFAKIGWVQTLLRNWMLFLPFSGVLGLFTLVMSKADDIHTKVQAIIAYLPTATWAGLYAKINVVLPMTETLAMFSLLLGLKVGCMIMRWIKALITNVVVGS